MLWIRCVCYSHFMWFCFLSSIYGLFSWNNCFSWKCLFYSCNKKRSLVLVPMSTLLLVSFSVCLRKLPQWVFYVHFIEANSSEVYVIFVCFYIQYGIYSFLHVSGQTVVQRQRLNSFYVISLSTHNSLILSTLLLLMINIWFHLHRTFWSSDMINSAKHVIFLKNLKNYKSNALSFLFCALLFLNLIFSF